jgi:tetratricopeptide (TPR) repeat protein
MFVINPTVSAEYGTLRNTVSQSFGIVNTDVRPSFSATANIAKQVMEDSPLLGQGPNTFAQSWLLYKPRDINATLFWNAAFPSGVGFVPTQTASIGIVGAVVWLLFLVFFLLLGIKSLAHLPEETTARFSIVGTFLASLFLWGASFLYTPSLVVISLAFIFTGLFIGSSGAAGILGLRKISFSHNAATNFASALAMVALSVGAVSFAFTVFQRTSSIYHFQKALILSNTAGSQVEQIENELVKAIRLAELDTYYSALSQLKLARAQSVLQKTDGTPEENRALFQSALSDSIAAAQEATRINPDNYRNWIALGSLYSSLVPKPLAVEGSYDSAKAALAEARVRHPYSPEVPFMLAKLELDKGNQALARAHIEESLSFKQDYADAYFLLTQLEIKENNIPGAIRSAETSAILSPDNAGVFFQLGLLKYQNADYSGAVKALNQALVILPGYANAKYFLGLSLEKLGQHDGALKHFEELVAANPDNIEIASILANLKAGKDPFNQIPSSVSSVPKRTSPPISERE